MPEVAEELAEEIRVKQLKKTQKIPVDELYYGNKVEFDLREVKLRKMRHGMGGVEKFEDFLVFYEKQVKIGDEVQKMAYYISPPPPDLFHEYYYPTAQWNISQPHLDDQDNIPDWQQRVVVDGEGNSVYVSGAPLRAFHYIVVNRSFTPERRPDGSDNDGLFVPHPPVTGEYIMQREEAKRTLGGDLLGMTRRRVGDEIVTVQR